MCRTLAKDSNDARRVRGHAGCEAMPHAPMKAGLLAKRLTRGRKAGRAQPGSGQSGVGCGKVALRQSLNLSLEASRRTREGDVATTSWRCWPISGGKGQVNRVPGGLLGLRQHLVREGSAASTCFRPCLSGARVWGRRDATIACLRSASFRWRAYGPAWANTAAARAVKAVTAKVAESGEERSPIAPIGQSNAGTRHRGPRDWVC